MPGTVYEDAVLGPELRDLRSPDQAPSYRRLTGGRQPGNNLMVRTMTGYVYVASSWRNQLQPDVVNGLRSAGIDCYDFRHPAPDNNGFSWVDIGAGATDRAPKPKGQDLVPVATYLKMINHPVAVEGFALPCGRSAHLELGWAVGAGKRTAILLEDPAELMYRMVDYLAPSFGDLLDWLIAGDCQDLIGQSRHEHSPTATEFTTSDQLVESEAS